MDVVVAAVAGFLVGRLAWGGVRAWFVPPALARPNYRGEVIPTATGLVLALALLAVAAVWALGDDLTMSRVAALTVTLGFCLLGAVDDVAGSGAERGFRGHLRALAAGRVTTGLVKLAAGGAVALVAVRPLAGGSVGRLVADAALVALCANAGNLLDRAPGRAGKVGLLVFLALVVGTGADPALAGVAVVAGAAAALLVPDLREELMLGDAGANTLGAVLGLGVVLATSSATRTAVLVLAAALNVAGELVSFSRVIDAVPPLRAVDRLGRPATWRSSG